MGNVLLNWMPPSMVEIPSPAMSVLKQYLHKNNFIVDIIYWNIKLNRLQCEFVWWPNPTLTQSETYANLLFNNYLAIKTKDRRVLSQIKSILISLKPQYLDVDIFFFDRHMQSFAHKLDIFLDNELNKIDFKNISFFGLSVNLYQWLCGSIIAKKVKNIAPNLPIVIGGIATKKSAISFLNNFLQFDIAVWGEGEHNTLSLAKYFTSSNSLENIYDIPNIAFRENGIIKVSNVRKNIYVDLNISEFSPSFDDYFSQLSQMSEKNKINPHLFIEGSRSCHWKKCHFCYLNTGYKHRLTIVR